MNFNIVDAKDTNNIVDAKDTNSIQTHADVRLCLDSTTCTTVIPNNTILHPGNISNAGLLCVSSLDENGIGNWFYPSGEQIINQQSSVFSSLQRIRHVGLFRGGAAFTSAAEGVYTCRIPDGSRVQQTLYVGIYQTSSYMNSGKQPYNTVVLLDYCKSLTTLISSPRWSSSGDTCGVPSTDSPLLPAPLLHPQLYLHPVSSHHCHMDPQWGDAKQQESRILHEPGAAKCNLHHVQQSTDYEGKSGGRVLLHSFQ